MEEVWRPRAPPWAQSLASLPCFLLADVHRLIMKAWEQGYEAYG